MEAGFLTGKDFTQAHFSRYDLAVALALDFGDFWASKILEGGDRLLVKLPRTVKMDATFSGVDETLTEG
jgi:hypothetical protein